uniref:Uncharacterized protein n=1 Tax=Arundo donax TaxID=35708 RepID=A0A0A9CPF2_ARUDO
MQEDRVVEVEAGDKRALGLEFHVAVGVRGAESTRERRHEGLHVGEGAELVGAGGVGSGGERGRRRGRGVVVGEVDGGDVVDAGAALVLAAGVEPDEVLLRVARHLRRRPSRHEVARDVPPVPPPVLLQPHQEQPESRNENSPFFCGKNTSGSTNSSKTMILVGVVAYLCSSSVQGTPFFRSWSGPRARLRQQPPPRLNAPSLPSQSRVNPDEGGELL